MPCDEPKAGDLLPDEWEPWILEWEKWDEEGAPKEAQAYVDAEEGRILGIGRHSDGRYFLSETFDQGNSPDYFAGWWSDVRREDTYGN